ncbi:MAG: Cell division protein FtsL [Mycoplasmataceae bacterium]|nr:MAG: Cell division protein FtsL [Mycoplasmataceae bacterium]
MISCCEIALTLAVTNVISLALFAGYTVKLKERTVKLEKKNGHEQHQIDQLRAEIENLKQKKHD